MSKPWTTPREPQYLGVHEVQGFRLKVYVITLPHEAPPGSETLADLAAAVGMNLSDMFSEEFVYHRVGFAVCNYGRRGLTISIVHFGLWVDTPEVFHVGWYRYNDSNEIELLDQREPVMCFMDSPWMIEEISMWRGALNENRSREVIRYENAYDSYLGRIVSFG